MPKRNNRPHFETHVRVAWVRTALRKVKGRLRVVIYARYSTDEQNPRSIDDQVRYAKRFLEALGIVDAEVTVIFDEGISGEKMFRPGIDRVRAGIEAGLWDLVLVEDSSRLFRNALACMEFVVDAVDRGVRIISVNDEIDTGDEEQWEDRLHDAARHHQRANKFTSRRINRAIEALWEMGAAVSQLKVGYLRNPTRPAKNGEPAEGPFHDEIDSAKAPIGYRVYEMIAAKDSPWSVANWLTEQKFPKAPNSSLPEWTDQNVIDFIRRTDHRGFQTFRKTVSKKKRKTGESWTEKNTSGTVLTRQLERLRLVPDPLWYAANQAVDERAPPKKRLADNDVATKNIPRAARGPLSSIFFCERCEHKMHIEVRSEGGFRCSKAKCRKCWNMATALREIVYDNIAESIVQQLSRLGPEIDQLVATASELLGDLSQREARCAELRNKEQALEVAVDRLAEAVEASGQEVSRLVQRLEKRETELCSVRAELEGVVSQATILAQPTRREIEERIEIIIGHVQQMNRSSRDELQNLVGAIWSVPYQQFGGNKVVLRARFELRLAALLPARTRAALATILDAPVYTYFNTSSMLVDLFEPTALPAFGLAALNLKEQRNIGPTAIGEILGISKTQAGRALEYGKKLRAAGLTDPYIELMQAPAKASRWGKRKPKTRVDA